MYTTWFYWLHVLDSHGAVWKPSTGRVQQVTLAYPTTIQSDCSQLSTDAICTCTLQHIVALTYLQSRRSQNSTIVPLGMPARAAASSASDVFLKAASGGFLQSSRLGPS